ncbi:ABC transporter substrate-binding protein [Novosphingopyxis sp. YJ-S2-01]|uniref:ABC transporter substrate-binding protein n=1 Tax=Novosphingopyxis sp. YJ-S2-01 TaxID=2794021 RepID=UPI0018DE5DD4|nr:ABC transporter substrate-binding protein [Novosphingopyxis sp. YJ-S2-01]MBH9538626.1 ABC transporter substrate-binding protein [Novosphingopyxis sp. YJ-S2-01]
MRYSDGMSRPVLSLAIGAVLILTGCGGAVDNESIAVTAIDRGEKDLNIGRLPLGTGAGLLRAATAQGLVSFDKEGRINPGLAERWIASEDGLSYIFRIGDAQWIDGGEVSARQVATILRQRIGELRRGGFSADLALIGDINAITGHVLEIQLERPRPNLLELLAQPEFGIVRRSDGSGPMISAREGKGMTLLHRSFNLEDGGEEAVPPRIRLRRREAARAVAAYLSGVADVVEGGRFQELPLAAAGQIEAAAISIDPTDGLFGLMVVNDSAFLADSSNRAAIAMAIDRSAALADFERPEWTTRESIFPDGLFGNLILPAPEWTGLSVPDRAAKGARRIAAWSAENQAPPTLRIAMPKGAGGRMLYARIAADLAAIGLATRRVGPQEDADLRLIDQVADYDGPIWYLARLTCPATPLCDEEADALVEQALAAPSLAERRLLLRDAAAQIQAANRFIPIATPLRFSLVRPGIEGHAPNSRGWHLLQYLGGGPIS